MNKSINFVVIKKKSKQYTKRINKISENKNYNAVNIGNLNELKLSSTFGSLLSETAKAGCIDSKTIISDGTNSFRVILFEKIKRRTANLWNDKSKGFTLGFPEIP